MIEGEQATEPVLSKDAAVRVGGFGATDDQSVLDTLVLPLAVVMLDELGDDMPKMSFAGRHDSIEALGSAGKDKSLGEGVEIGTPQLLGPSTKSVIGLPAQDGVAEHLPPTIVAAALASPATVTAAAVPAGAVRAAIPTLEEVELAHIRRVLDVCGGNRTLAAQFLGITRQTLTKRLGGATDE